MSLCRGGWVVLAQGLRARVVWLGAEPARLAELYWLSLVLKASARLRDLRVSLAGSRGPARVTGSIVAVPVGRELARHRSPSRQLSPA